MDFRCHNCGETGHYARNCPAMLPGTLDAGQISSDIFNDHLARIDRYVEDWFAGKISIDEKRRLISAENVAYYGESCPRKLRWP